MADWLEQSASVDPAWSNYFEQLNGAIRKRNGQARNTVALAARGGRNRLRALSVGESPDHCVDSDSPSCRKSIDATGLSDTPLQELADRLTHNFRLRGHLAAELDPLARERPGIPELTLAHYGLQNSDLRRPVSTQWMPGTNTRRLGDLFEHLRCTYCRHIGVQFMHINDPVARDWLQQRMERTGNRTALQRRWKYRILSCLAEAVVFEEFIQKKFIGAKRFSLEGAETLIPLLDFAIEHAAHSEAEDGSCVEDIVIGMAHRGRLNVLTNILGKSPRAIFREFEDTNPDKYLDRGDVKYHLGYSAYRQTRRGRNVHLSLCFNPSHLEFVNPVALGRTRARQQRFKDQYRRRCLTLLIHGDAGFAGEGIVQESLNLSDLQGFSTGGAVHVVINNQLGFTTTPKEGRSTPYCTDVATMLQSPIFHVNGEYPEAVANVVRLALDFRQRFQKDVFIDLYCYRLRGHNEGDEPAFTQPLMYEKIRNRPSVADSYCKHLVEMGGLADDDVEQIVERHRQWLEEELSEARNDDNEGDSTDSSGPWSPYEGRADPLGQLTATGVDANQLSTLLATLTEYPDDFHPHPKIERGLKRRREMANGDAPLDWAATEALAIASLAADGTQVRLSGQDSARGTFSQRHAVLHDVNDGDVWKPFERIAAEPGTVAILNSPLSEASVLGFEYGYSLDSPDSLVMW